MSNRSRLVLLAAMALTFTVRAIVTHQLDEMLLPFRIIATARS